MKGCHHYFKNAKHDSRCEFCGVRLWAPPKREWKPLTEQESKLRYPVRRKAGSI